MITSQQFEILSTLTRRPDGPSQEAARLVLVEGRTNRQAAEETGISISGVIKSVNRYRLAVTLIEGYGGTLKSE